jgi:phage FluMu gp28-like protein
VELCTFSVAFKREIFPLLRRQFTAPAQVRVPVSRQVREDLHAMQQVVTNGEYNYWAPRTREGHSDRCTALALAVRAAGQTGTRGGTVLTAQTAPLIRFGGQHAGGLRFQPGRLG